MTAQEVRLCGLLLQEGGAQNLRTIANETNTPLDLVLNKRPGSPVEYRASCEWVLSVLLYPRYIYTAKTLYGDAGELIVEEVQQRGHMTLSNTVKTVADRLTHNMEDGRSMEYSEVVSAFSKLVETHFLQCCTVNTLSHITRSTFSPACIPTCKPPAICNSGRGKRRRSSDDSEEQRGGKKVKMNSESCGDEGIYWQVNFERFHQHFRDQSVISAVASKLDQVSVTDPYRPPPYRTIEDHNGNKSDFLSLRHHINKYCITTASGMGNFDGDGGATKNMSIAGLRTTSIPTHAVGADPFRGPKLGDNTFTF
uniref:DNA-directed RNA polymerase III subunit RPC3 n=1 Tax=Oncorhynchus mykiss TaxID=8022 RepID=A0A8C7LVK4_ONCMY